MRKFLIESGNTHSYWMIFPLACVLAVIGAKCWMISAYASPTPFWDQWDAEAALLYQPYFAGTLQLSDLFAPHNEHRMLIHRLWSLMLLALNGYWDPILQMVVNTLLSGVASALLIAMLRPILDVVSLIVIALFSMIIFELTLAWENVLAGIASHWYFFMLASVTGLFLLHNSTAFAARWWMAVLLIGASYFCMAGGALTFLAATALCATQFAVRRRSGTKELLALAILTVLCVGCFIYIPLIPGHKSLQAQSIGQFIRAMMHIGGWPVAPPRTPVAVLLICTAIIHTPAILLSACVISQRPALADRRWFVMALTGWTMLNAVAMAYGRAPSPVESRYLDLFSLSLLLNCACLLYSVHITSDSSLRRKLAFGAIAVWLLLVLPGAVEQSLHKSALAMAERQTLTQIQTENLRAYLTTNDINVLANKPLLHIPYPDAQRLAMIASWPAIRAILPPALVGETSAAATRERGVARFTGRAADSFKRFMLRHGFLLIPIGLTLLLGGLLIRGLQSKTIVASLIGNATAVNDEEICAARQKRRF